MLKFHYKKCLMVMKMNNIEEQYEPYDYSQDFSPEELYEEKEEPQYQSLEDKLREVGMSIHDFI